MEVKILEAKQIDPGKDVYFVRINYMGREYAETVSVAGLELALISLPKEKSELRGLFAAYKQAIEQINTAAKEIAVEPEMSRRSRKAKEEQE